ncbi:MAG: transglycosylase SLT domain-containing protein [Gemmatimonadota bacterium]
MHDLRNTYVHYGDKLRRRRKIRAALICAGFFVASVGAAADWRPETARAAAIVSTDRLPLPPAAEVTTDSDWFSGEDLDRWNRIFTFARRYNISADLAAAIHDEAIAQKVDPELAFRVVRLESRFQESAKSPVGAIGLTQLMLPTARIYEPGISADSLHDRHTNLRIGFKYLHDLLKQYRDVKTALLVYNRGPLAVLLERELGIDPSNGYDHIVLKGYRGKGLLQ